MIKKKYICLMLLFFIYYSCKENKPNPEFSKSYENNIKVDSASENKELDYDPDEWNEILENPSGIVLDIKYATKNNFTNEIIYPCGRCLLRPELASKLISLNKGIMDRYQLKLMIFDCYRPLPAQQRLWDIVPNPNYVTPPKKGSMHNRGLAVDITLTDLAGTPLEMGTEYDHFGIEAHTDNLDLPSQILANRKLLMTMMEEIGLKGIRTEWWHYSMQSSTYELSSWEWSCD